MSSEIVTLRRETELTEICAVMLQYRQRDFPVVNGAYQLVGMLYEESLLKPLLEQFRKKCGDAPNYSDFKSLMEYRDFLGVTANQLMIQEDTGVPSDLDIVRAGAIMSARRVRQLAVIADNRVVGMVSGRAIFLHLMHWANDPPQASLPIKLTEKFPEAAKIQGIQKEIPVNNRRKFERLKTAIKVAYKLADAEGKALKMPGRFCICLNVSLGGMLLELPELLPLKHLIIMAFEIPGSGVPIKRLARVGRVSGSATTGRYQTGVMFLALSVNETAAMQQLLNTLRSRK